MLRIFCLTFFVALMLSSCGPDESQHKQDSLLADSIITAAFSDPSEFGMVHSRLLLLLQPQMIPDWMHVDTVRSAGLSLSHEEAIAVFPSGFGIPEEVNVTALSKQDVDSLTHIIWYRMELQGADGKDIWAVLYNDTSALAAHLASTKGAGYGYAKIDSPTTIREVVIQPGEKTVVTTKMVTITEGKFVSSDGEISTFGPDNLAGEKAQAVADKFFGIKWP